MYKVVLECQIEKKVSRFPQLVQQKIFSVLKDIKQEPYPANCKKLIGYKDFVRVRIGEYHIVYSVKNDILTIFVIDIDHRKDVYK